jgi:hypothetical protein
MKLEKVKKLAEAWRAIDAVDMHDTWPDSVPKEKRTLEYMDECKVANHVYERHCVKHFFTVVKTLRLALQHTAGHSIECMDAGKEQCGCYIGEIEKVLRDAEVCAYGPKGLGE